MCSIFKRIPLLLAGISIAIAFSACDTKTREEKASNRVEKFLNESKKEFKKKLNESKREFEKNLDKSKQEFEKQLEESISDAVNESSQMLNNLDF